MFRNGCFSGVCSNKASSVICSLTPYKGNTIILTGVMASQMGDTTGSPTVTVMSVGEDIPALFPALILMVRLHIGVSTFWGSLILMITGYPG